MESVSSAEDNEVDELKLVEGVNLWSAKQQVLENQALKELELLSKAETDLLEDGEIVDNEPDCDKDKTILNIQSYIKRQEELKKRQDFKKSLVDCESVNQKGKRKRKHSTTFNTNIDKSTTDEHISCNEDSGSEYFPSDEELADFDHTEIPSTSERKIKQKKQQNSTNKDLEKVRDDGDIQLYKLRLDHYYKRMETESYLNGASAIDDDVNLGGKLKLPKKIWNKLYSYQQDGIRWLWGLHQKVTGGILGDEMGLGKTVQTIAFLYALHYSSIGSCGGRYIGVGPTIIVCPATVLNQWVKHFYEWAPEFRVAVLHQSGTFQGNRARLIKEINKSKGILLTTYIGILKFKGNLVEYGWHYIILDEGHKIRNCSSKVSCAVKEIRTPFRLMLTGSPMQNNLQELWSLFDFTNPGMLGNLNTFTEHFINPILQGGFSNASSMQEAAALSVATALKNIISPYLLRRAKNEVQDSIQLPSKCEQVLFCSLSEEQKTLYKDYLMSEHVNNILGRGKSWTSDNYFRANMLVAITTLRKICNHPQLYLCKTDDDAEPSNESVDWSNVHKRSGKMIVVSALLKIWKKQGHRSLLFTQGRAVMVIFENFLNQNGYKYLKMDGTTSISSRQGLIEKFNKDSSFDVFLLTTRVGGLGVNLTGANRVIIYDPDWNPATDTQARERAWRIGQEKDVTIYRLLSAGTIEEKMYQRQVWKQLLSNKILIDPKTRKIFKSSDLYDLFSLQEHTSDTNPETANIFQESRIKIQAKIKEKSERKRKKLNDLEEINFTEDKLQAMRNLAHELAKSLEPKKVIKTPYQKELEEERSKKLEEKNELKKLTPQELLIENRLKALQCDDPTINRVDDCEAPCSFAKALEYTEKTAQLYQQINTDKRLKKVDKHINKAVEIKKEISERLLRKKKCKTGKTLTDHSGKIDGEKVEGLIKTECKKNKEIKRTNTEKSDYVLSKLLTKGVSGALEHDSVVQVPKVREGNLRIQSEASERAEKALQALRKSRLDNWRW